MITHDDFDAFFEASTGYPPFAWQRRLMDYVTRHGRWPDTLNAPTGSGKTSVIDIHVFAVALMVSGAGARVPRRLAMVVDRRVLVDDQHEHAAALARRLATALTETGVVGCVARALASLRRPHPTEIQTGPLIVARLRGGEPPTTLWREEPEACAVVCATPDMWGSRLLMRGYGSSRRAWPVEAGLLSHDCAVVVDEAHLTRQLLRTARRVAEIQAVATPIGVPPLQVVETTATPSEDADAVTLGVQDEDLSTDATLRGRLNARKELRRLPHGDWPMKRTPSPAWTSVMVDATVALAAEAQQATQAAAPGSGTPVRTVGCFVNTVAGAVAVYERVSKAGLRALLVCGRVRRVDLARARAGGNPTLAEAPEGTADPLTCAGDPDLDVIVATQSLEVGVDVDLAAAVSELAPAASLAQRAGRVNRRGDRAFGVFHVVHGHETPGRSAKDAGSGPYPAHLLADSFDWLDALGDDIAPAAVRVLPPPSPPPPILRRLEWTDAELLTHTSDPLSAEPDLDVWLADDPLSVENEVAVVPRAGLTGDPARDLPYLRATAVHPAEAYPTRLDDARALAKSLTNGASPLPVYLQRPDDIGAMPPGDTDVANLVRPGDVIIVPDFAHCIAGSPDMGVVASNGKHTAADRMEEAAAMEHALDLRVGVGLPFALNTHADIDGFLESAAALELTGRSGRDALAAQLTDVANTCRTGPWSEHARAVATAMRSSRLTDFDVALLADTEGVPWCVCIRDMRRRMPEEVLQLASQRPAAEPVGLMAHQAAVAERAARIAETLGVEPELQAAAEFAGAHHDDGKADARFQTMLGASEDVRAKSGMTSRAQVMEALARSGLPRGWRHEQASVACHADLTDDLLDQLKLRLIGTTHGHGRPSFPHAGGLLSVHDPLRGACDRMFNDGRWAQIHEDTQRVYGPWGCALLEAVVRGADVQISREGG